MAKRDELLLNTDALMKALLLPLTVAVFLTLQGTAEAAQCEDPMDPEWLTPPVIAPAPADTLAIMNVISHYNWARDEKVSKGFKDLFTTTVVFEACTDGGKVQAAKELVQTMSPAILVTLQPFSICTSSRLWHFTSNTILNLVSPDTVQGKAAVLVTLQNGYSETPELDYTATLKAEFKRGTDGNWRFNKLSILVDSPVPPPSGARGR